MASPSETTLIVLGTAAQAALIAPQDAQFWQIVTAMGLTITPLLARIGHDVARRIELRRQDETQAMNVDSRKRTVIVGCGRVGKLVAQMLVTHNRPYIAIDADIDTIAAARKDGYSAMFGDITRPGMLDRLGLDNAAALVLTMDDPVQAVRIVTNIRKNHPDLPVVARARDPRHAAELYRAGVTDAVPETIESSLQLSEAVLVDLGVAMGPVIASIHEKRAELRTEIMRLADIDREPRLWRRRIGDKVE